MAYHIDQIYKQGDNMMCTKQCPCNIADKAKFKGWSSLPNKKVSKSGYTNFLDCPAETLSKGHQDRYVPMMTALETQFKCAGICELPRFYLFSDINNGKPTELCKDYAIQHIKENTSTFAAYTFVASSIGFIGFLFSCSICYWKKNKLQYSWEKY